MRISVPSGRSKIQRLRIKRVQCLTFPLIHESHHLAHEDYIIFFLTMNYANEFPLDDMFSCYNRTKLCSNNLYISCHNP